LKLQANTKIQELTFTGVNLWQWGFPNNHRMWSL